MPIIKLNPLANSYIPLDVNFFDKKALEKQKRFDKATELIANQKLTEDALTYRDKDAREQYIKERDQLYDNVINKYKGDLSAGYSEILDALSKDATHPYHNLRKLYETQYSTQQQLINNYGDRASVYKQLPTKLYDNSQWIDPASLTFEVVKAPDYTTIADKLTSDIQNNVYPQKLKTYKNLTNFLQSGVVSQYTDTDALNFSKDDNVLNTMLSMAINYDKDKRTNSLTVFDNSGNVDINATKKNLSAFLYGYLKQKINQRIQTNYRQNSSNTTGGLPYNNHGIQNAKLKVIPVLQTAETKTLPNIDDVFDINGYYQHSQFEKFKSALNRFTIDRYTSKEIFENKDGTYSFYGNIKTKYKTFKEALDALEKTKAKSNAAITAKTYIDVARKLYPEDTKNLTDKQVYQYILDYQLDISSYTGNIYYLDNTDKFKLLPDDLLTTGNNTINTFGAVYKNGEKVKNNTVLNDKPKNGINQTVWGFTLTGIDGKSPAYITKDANGNKIELSLSADKHKEMVKYSNLLNDAKTLILNENPTIQNDVNLAITKKDNDNNYVTFLLNFKPYTFIVSSKMPNDSIKKYIRGIINNPTKYKSDNIFPTNDFINLGVQTFFNSQVKNRNNNNETPLKTQHNIP